MYIQRPLASSILNCNAKVAIIEGARAVGKTALVRNELEPKGFAYYSLADPATYDYAVGNLTAWINSLQVPAIIDEAQRIPDLPLAIKERVDQLPDLGVQIILTGSASINRKGLEGQDPLARRSRRFTLHPLTKRELLGDSASLVDDLWSSDINLSYRSAMQRKDLLDVVALGGFPQYALATRLTSARERYLSIKDDIDGVLGDTILPGEQLDKTTAHAVLRGLLGLPGGILNVSRIAKELGFDSRTINRYIGIFERRFLIHALPNLRLAAHKQNVSHSRIHPVDTSFSCELLSESGKDPIAEPVLFGGILESFVINQIVSAIQWSSALPDRFYWRETGARPKEVDLVLVSGNELIGIEVKASTRVKPSDFYGLKALSEDERFKRGFVIYTGETVIQEADNLWALPISALWDKEAFVAPERANRAPSPRTMSEQRSKPANQPADANILLSYAHADNDYLDGAIVRLVDDIAREYQFQFGSVLNIFIDTRSISWGADWQNVLKSAIDGTTFIMPAVTPNYIASQACRDELQRFISRGEKLTNGHVLSLIWQGYRSTSAAEQNPSIVSLIDRYQYEDVSGLRDLDPSDKQYKQRVRELTSKIREHVIEDLETAPSASPDETPSDPEAAETPELGLVDRLERLNADAESFGSCLEATVNDLSRIQSAIGARPAPQNGDINALASWCKGIEQDAEEPAGSMRKNLADARASWERIYETTSALIDTYSLLHASGHTADGIRSLRLQLTSTKSQLDPISDLESQMTPFTMLTVLSPRLRFLVNAMNELINTVNDIRAALDDLINQIDSIS